MNNPTFKARHDAKIVIELVTNELKRYSRQNKLSTRAKLLVLR